MEGQLCHAPKPQFIHGLVSLDMFALWWFSARSPSKIDALSVPDVTHFILTARVHFTHSYTTQFSFTLTFSAKVWKWDSHKNGIRNITVWKLWAFPLRHRVSLLNQDEWRSVVHVRITHTHSNPHPQSNQTLTTASYSVRTFKKSSHHKLKQTL